MTTKADLIALLRECQKNFIGGELSDRIDAALAPEAGETVRVKVAVAIDDEGSWSAYGDDGLTGPEAASEARDFNKSESVIYFIEASIPMPVSKTGEGEVTT